MTDRPRRPIDPDETSVLTPVVRHEPKSSGNGEACLVVIYGSDLGRRIPLGAGDFEIGRSSASDLALDQESVSRHHARITRGGAASGRSLSAANAAPYMIADLGSTNGTYVNDTAVTERKLKDGDQIKVGHSIMKFMTGDNVEHSYHEEIYRLMTVDGLTQVFNKRYFTEALEREFNRCRRYKRDLSLMIIDIDFFKIKNDEYGHVAGDALLKQMATAVNEKLRREDIFARVGGEEFAVILPEVGIVAALVTAEKVRAIVEESRFTFDQVTMACTVSVGLATTVDSTGGPEELYGVADAALYSAKKNGRNRVAT